MIKTILKEMIIILLLCVAILFILSVLFYDYNPVNKVVPNKIAYTVPENIQEELNENSIQSTLSIENKVYTIEASDLNIYKKSNSYNPSKENPFATVTAENGNVASGEGNTGTNVKDPGTNPTVNTNANANDSPNANTNAGETTKPPTGLK